MPLVTITASDKFYPRDDGTTGDAFPVEQLIAVRLAENMPKLIADNAFELGLDPDQTPEEGVQVDIKKFHHLAVNVVDLWVQIQFAESYPGLDLALKARDNFIAMLRGQLLEPEEKSRRVELNFSRALDMFWGPDHGCLFMPDSNRIKFSW